MSTTLKESDARRDVRKMLKESKHISEGQRIRFMDDYDTMAFTLRVPKSQRKGVFGDAFCSVFGDGLMQSNDLDMRYDDDDDSLPAHMSRVALRLQSAMIRNLRAGQEYTAEAVISAFLLKYKYFKKD